MESFLQGLTASYTNEKVALSSADWRAPSSFRSTFLQRKWDPRGARVCRPESGSTGLVFPQERGDAVLLPVLPTSRMRNRHHLDSAPPRRPETASSLTVPWNPPSPQRWEHIWNNSQTFYSIIGQCKMHEECQIQRKKGSEFFSSEQREQAEKNQSYRHS